MPAVPHPHPIVTHPSRPARGAARGRAFAAIRAILPMLVVLGLGTAGAGAAEDGEAETPHELSLAHVAQQPASMVTCSYGYWAEKEGNHAAANAIFDRCIEAGYVGAMIWKALLYEEGNGVPRDLEKATALLHRAATSGDSGYATLGKLHYATALYLGKGVARDEAEAMKWFRAAAAEGDADAQEFLLTGHHTADRDMQGRGVGEQPLELRGQHLAKLAPAAEPQGPAGYDWLLVLALGAAFAAGLGRQARAGRGARDTRAQRLASEGA